MARATPGASSGPHEDTSLKTALFRDNRSQCHWPLDDTRRPPAIYLFLIKTNSIGAFSHSATTFAFHSVTTTTDLAVYEAGVAAEDPTQTYYFSPEPLLISHTWIADGLVDRCAPVGTTISGSYPTGTGGLAEPLILVDYYGPDADTDNSYVKRYLLDGGLALTYSFQTRVEGRCATILESRG